MSEDSDIPTFNASFGTDAKKTFEPSLGGRVHIISRIDSQREALCCKYNEEYDYIAVGYGDGVITMYQSTTGEHVFTLADAEVRDNRAPVTSIKHRPVSTSYPTGNCYIGTYANGCVKCWSYNFNQCLYTINEKRQTFGLVYHPIFPKFITFGDDLKINYYDEETRTKERVLASSNHSDRHDGHKSRVFAGCFHPQNNHELITGGWDDVIQFWDLRDPHANRHISGVHMCGEGLDINTKGTEILTCAWQNLQPLQIFDYRTTKRICAMDPDAYDSKLYCGKYATKDFIVCAGANPNLIRVVDLQTSGTSASITELPGAIYGLDLGPPKVPMESKPTKFVFKNDIPSVPKIAFVSGKRLYQIDFY